MTGTIFDIKEMAVHDGPGIRTTVFLKGCPLRCRWCHNPEGLESEPQLMYKEARCLHCGQCRVVCNHAECRPFGRCVRVCPEDCLQITGERVEAATLAARLIETAAVLGESFGGFTFSGGEPLAQPDFLLELMEALRPHHLCIETSGHADPALFRRVVDRLDFVIMDVKLADPAAHKHYTGVDNARILQNLHTLMHGKTPYVIRTPLIPAITDTEENLNAVRNLIGDSPWETIPYNAAAGAKYAMLGKTYSL